MMTAKNKPFTRIALMARQYVENVGETLDSLIEYLEITHKTVVLEKETAELVKNDGLKVVSANQLNKHCDLIIVVGGDGSFLHAGRVATGQALPILGINRGRLGFLTDIRPDQLELVGGVLGGHYWEEQRFLLTMRLYKRNKVLIRQDALNDAVLSPGQGSHMTKFKVYIDGEFVCTHRADGMIIATPTGSTAHALSGGGPILHPSLDVMSLVPMQSHTLSSRPIVVSGESKIEIKISSLNDKGPYVCCDGQERTLVSPGSRIVIAKKKKKLSLIHPMGYHYFETLREKLHWR